MFLSARERWLAQRRLRCDHLLLTMSFTASIITLFPEAFPGVLGVSLIGKALRDGLWTLETTQLRDFGQGPHKNVDDTPAGGGAGMVLRADVAAAAIDSVLDRRSSTCRRAENSSINQWRANGRQAQASYSFAAASKA